MSWSVSKTGHREAVSAAVAAELDKCAANYKGQEEEKDVLAAKERILAAIAGVDTTPDEWVDGCSTYGVQVTASGSASKFSMNMQVAVQKVPLTLNAVPPAAPVG